jgi:hypothetical protein
LRRGRGEYLPEDILKAVKARRMQMWVAEDGEIIKAVGVTTITVFPRLKVCEFILLGGSGLLQWRHEKEQIMAWARRQGCQEIRGGGRKGWLRVSGWPWIYTICGERIDD